MGAGGPTDTDEVVDGEEEEGDDFIFLDDNEQWALWIHEGENEAVLVHAHGEIPDDPEAVQFVECDEVEGDDGVVRLVCTGCGVSLTVAEVDAMVEALADEEDDKEDDAKA